MKLIIGVLIWAATLNAQPHSNALTWAWSQGTGDAATGFHVQRAVNGAPAVVVATLNGVAIKTYTDTNVVAGQTSVYTVTAFNTGGDSTPSSPVTCVTPFSTPQTPTGLSAVTQ